MTEEFIATLVRPNVQRLEPYASARDEFAGQGEVFLDANESPFDSGLNRYPDPQQRALKEVIAKREQLEVGQLFLGNGSDEAIDLLYRAFCSPGRDQVMLCPPTYGMYEVSAAINDVECIRVPLQEDFQLNIPAIVEAAAPDVKLLFICSPNNPTGNEVYDETIETLLQRFQGLVVFDEAYGDFSEAESATRFIGRYANVVVLKTFSKAWGKAGIRLGMAMANPTVIEVLNKIKPPYNVNQLTQQAALGALADVSTMKGEVLSIIAERKRVKQQLSGLAGVQRVYPSDANFLLVKMDQAEYRYKELIAQGIVVRNRSKVLLCEDCLRITIGLPSENDQLLKALQTFEIENV